MKVEHLFDKDTYTLTYIVYDEGTKDALIIDPVLDFDPASGRVSTSSFSLLKEKVNELSLKVGMILETHAHADHLSSSQYLKDAFQGAKLAIGENICVVQETFKKVFNMPESFKVDGSQFDLLLKDGEMVSCGSLNFKVLATPGHTPACVSFVFDGFVFTGDALFMPDFGTGRCDFPAGSADELYTSVHDKLYKLDDDTVVYVGHDYMPKGRPLKYATTIKEEKENNIQLKESSSRSDFVAMRKERDAKLNAPTLLFPSIQVNIAAGKLPDPEGNGTSYVKIPLKK